MIDAPKTCGCCGSQRLTKLGEDITKTLEVIPRQWKVIQTVREVHLPRLRRLPSHLRRSIPTPRGWASPSLLAMILFEKFGRHQPLNRQSERFAHESVGKPAFRRWPTR